MKKLILGIAFVIMATLICALPAMASENVRPDIAISPNGGTVSAGSRLTIATSYLYGVDEIFYSIGGEKHRVKNQNTIKIDLPNKVGGYILYVQATCKAKGHYSWSWKEVYINIVDTLPPTQCVSPYTGELFLGDEILISAFDRSSRKCTIRYYWDTVSYPGKPYNEETIVIHEDVLPVMIDETLSQGIHILFVQTLDESGNTVDWKAYMYKIVHKYRGQDVLDKMIRGERV